MRSNLAQIRHLIAVAFFGLIHTFPIFADAFSEAVPQPTENKAKSEQNESVPSSAPAQETSFDEGPNDPLEPLNRLFFGINELVDFVILHPAAEIYRAITPEPVRNGVTNVLDNIFSPVVFINHALQGEPERAAATLFRFMMNSTFGIGGLADVTTELGYPRYDTDFNETLMAWGVDTGPYLVIPLIGPASFRGATGFVGDYFADPLNLYLNNRHHRDYRYWLTVRYGLDIINRREKVIETIENLKKNSLDMYVTMRSIYFQRQAYRAEKLKSVNRPSVVKEEGKPSTS
jgi:phospholipid-binding lipoprotein MlaA